MEMLKRAAANKYWQTYFTNPQTSQEEIARAKRLFSKKGKYEPLIKISQGGSGVVHAIQERRSGKLKALKIQKEESETSAFPIMHEKGMLQELEGFEFVPHLSSDRSSKNLEPFMIMDFLEGVTLTELKKETAKEENRKEVFQLLGKIARIYTELVKEYKILHRDVKPGNLILDREGQVYLVDFGIAVKESAIDKQTVSSGTAKYMPKERIAITEHRRSDIYSLAIVFFELIEGVHPLSAQTEETVSDVEPVMESIIDFHMRGEFQRTIDRTANLPDRFRRLLLSMTNEKAEKRPEYQEVEEEMKAVLQETNSQET